MSALTAMAARAEAYGAEIEKLLRRVERAGRAGYTPSEATELHALNLLARQGLAARRFVEDNGGDQPSYGRRGWWLWTITPEGRKALRGGRG